MFSRNYRRVDIQMVTDKIKINFRGFTSVPSKYVDIVSEEFN